MVVVVADERILWLKESSGDGDAAIEKPREQNETHFSVAALFPVAAEPRTTTIFTHVILGPSNISNPTSESSNRTTLSPN